MSRAENILVTAMLLGQMCGGEYAQLIHNSPCKNAVPDGDGGWECLAYRKCDCEHQKRDYNPDGTVNFVWCVKEDKHGR